MKNTTAASKYIPRRPRISINLNPPFQTQIYLVNSKKWKISKSGTKVLLLRLQILSKLGNFSAMQEWLDLGGGWLQFLHLKKLEKRWKNHQNPTVGCWDTTFCPPLPQFWCLSIGFDPEPPKKPLFLILVTFLTKNGFWRPFDTFAMKCWQNQSPRVVGQADDYGNAVMHPCYDATSQNRWIRLKFEIWDLAPKIT